MARTARRGSRPTAPERPDAETQKPRKRGAFSDGRTGLIAHLLLHVLPAFLRVDRTFGGQARLQALQPDLLAGVDAESVVAGIHALERAVDLADQLAVAVARAQLQRILGLAGGALGLIAD